MAPMDKTHPTMWVYAVEYRPGLLLIDLQASHTLQALTWGHSGIYRSSSLPCPFQNLPAPPFGNDALFAGLFCYFWVPRCSRFSQELSVEAPLFCLIRSFIPGAVPQSQHLSPCRVLGAIRMPVVTFSFPFNVGLPFPAVRPFFSAEKRELQQAWLVAGDLP